MCPNRIFSSFTICLKASIASHFRGFNHFAIRVGSLALTFGDVSVSTKAIEQFLLVPSYAPSGCGMFKVVDEAPGVGDRGAGAQEAYSKLEGRGDPKEDSPAVQLIT